MRIRWMGSGVALSSARRHEIERTAREILANFAARIPELRIRVRDLNGPRGGIDKEAVLEADFARRRRLTVSQEGASGRDAIRLALRRLAHAVSRRLKRDVTLLRKRPRHRRGRAGSSRHPRTELQLVGEER